ncbi:NUDIX domain-containing protein [Sphingosinicella sp. BN140058]|uniref:NUDIX domain-containing protein n=1 Tax=Sphingosinicella sp. BN140058 TaxID=1892855 RepID=UPI00101399EA|nr:NUDIX domain-containing protein [Sphingosinicella sp. BN140058]QAY75177.1 NUDIX domain-containing protein [Sphingosinicella sp. BN140058]
MRRLLDLLYRVQKRMWRIFRPRTRGVKVMLIDRDGAILLIRNNYGRSDLWVLPGGGIRPFEAPEAAAGREVREELGCGLRGLSLRATLFSGAEGKRDTVFLFAAEAVGDPAPASLEVAEAGWFALDTLPQATSPATRRRIDEHFGRRAADGRW